MTGCELLVVLTLLRGADGSMMAVHARPVLRGRCQRVRVRFDARPPIRIVLCQAPWSRR